MTELYLNPVEVSALKSRIELNNRQIAECQAAFNGLLLAIFDGRDMEFPEGQRPQIDLTAGAERITWEDGEHDGVGTADAGEGTAHQHGHEEGPAGPAA